MSNKEKMPLPMGRFLFNTVLIIALVLVPAVLAISPRANADPKPGLWQEGVTHADGVLIRKIRDTTGGDRVVCYVASETTSNTPMAVAVSISCAPEKP